MFARYTEKARRSIFFARYESSNLGSRSIQSEHLLLGLLREDKALAYRFLKSFAEVERIRKQVEANARHGETIPLSMDLPLSEDSQRALAHAVEQADQLRHKYVGTEHILLGLLEEQCFAAELLHQRGVDSAEVRRFASILPEDEPSSAPTGLRENVGSYLCRQEMPAGATLALQQRLLRDPNARTTDVVIFHSSGDAPFLCIEIIQRDERFDSILDRVNGYLALHARYIWLLEPKSRRAYTATWETGLREFKGQMLRTADPKIELPLAAIFG